MWAPANVSLQRPGDLRKLASLAIYGLARSFCEAACGVKRQLGKS